MSSYDAIPYPSYAFAATAPDRLATLGAVFGLDTPDPRTARVLELGSSSGGNLLPLAATCPGAVALGLDLSARQIGFGRHTAQALGLTNLRLEVADLATWTPEPAAWDYVICHGVYSWVPAPVRTAILGICARALSPHGVAVVSWNTNPGWHLQGVVRDAMRTLTGDVPLPLRAARAQDVVRVLGGLAAEADTPYARMLASKAALLELTPSSYVAHEYLEADNDPLYLAEFTRQAHAAGLRYLCDSTVGSSLPQLLPAPLRDAVLPLASSHVELEQYLDFLTCRPFRISLLVRPDAPVRHDLDRADLSGTWLSLADPPPDGEEAEAWPEWAALLARVHAAWPGTASFEEAIAAAQAAGPRADRRALTNAILFGAFTGELGLHRVPHDGIARAGERPVAWSVARHQAGRQHLVTTQRHETIECDPLDLLLLHASDGTRSVGELAALVGPLLRADPEHGLGPDASDDAIAAVVRARLDALSAHGCYVA